MIRYLGLPDYLIIAEAVLGVSAEEVFGSCDIAAAESALHAPAAGYNTFEAHPTIAEKAAVLAFQLCRNHPLLYGNKRVAYESLREFVARNGYDWTAPAADNPSADETVKVMWDLAAGQLSLAELTAWVAQRIGGIR